MSSTKGKPPKGIPFIAEFTRDGERNVRMELQRLLALKAPTAADAALRVQLERYLADPFTAAAQDQDARERALNALIGEAEQRALRRGGKTGRKNTATDRVRDHIRELIAKYPKLSPPQLYKKADPRIYRKMAQKTFENHTRALRAK